MDEPEPVDSVLTFLSGYDTLEYSWVKATAISVRLRILFVTLQNTNTCSGIPLAVRFVGRDRWLWNSMVQETQRFRLVRAASCVIPYVVCAGLFCLTC